MSPFTCVFELLLFEAGNEMTPPRTVAIFRPAFSIFGPKQVLELERAAPLAEFVLFIYYSLLPLKQLAQRAWDNLFSLLASLASNLALPSANMVGFLVRVFEMPSPVHPQLENAESSSPCDVSLNMPLDSSFSA